MSLIRLPAPRGTGRVVRPRIPGSSSSGGILGDIIGGGIGGVIGGMGSDSVTVTGRRYRRRAKGITGAELKAFSRVTRIIDKYAHTRPPQKHAARRACAPRRRR